jgi:hypothetical protein
MSGIFVRIWCFVLIWFSYSKLSCQLLIGGHNIVSWFMLGSYRSRSLISNLWLVAAPYSITSCMDYLRSNPVKQPVVCDYCCTSRGTSVVPQSPTRLANLTVRGYGYIYVMLRIVMDCKLIMNIILYTSWAWFSVLKL